MWHVLSHVRLSVTPGTVAHQAPLSMGFSKQEYWSGFSSPSLGDPPNPRNQSHVSCISCIGRWIPYQCITWEVPSVIYNVVLLFIMWVYFSVTLVKTPESQGDCSSHLTSLHHQDQQLEHRRTSVLNSFSQHINTVDYCTWNQLWLGEKQNTEDKGDADLEYAHFQPDLWALPQFLWTTKRYRNASFLLTFPCPSSSPYL